MASTPSGRGTGRARGAKAIAELETLRPFFDQLGPRARQVVDQTLAGKSAVEIAVAASSTLQAVYVALSAARTRLRKLAGVTREGSTRPAPEPPTNDPEDGPAATAPEVGLAAISQTEACPTGTSQTDGEPDAGAGAASPAPISEAREATPPSRDLGARLEALRPFFDGLSPRSREIVELRAKGMTPATIAEKLGMGASTV